MPVIHGRVYPPLFLTTTPLDLKLTNLNKGVARPGEEIGSAWRDCECVNDPDMTCHLVDILLRLYIKQLDVPVIGTCKIAIETQTYQDVIAIKSIYF